MRDIEYAPLVSNLPAVSLTHTPNEMLMLREDVERDRRYGVCESLVSLLLIDIAFIALISKTGKKTVELHFCQASAFLRRLHREGRIGARLFRVSAVYALNIHFVEIGNASDRVNVVHTKRGHLGVIPANAELAVDRLKVSVG
jgi:hypothetical protein